MCAPTARPGAAAPLVSIVTVSLNAAATIEDTLASVAMQRAEFDMEHICVDGGSNDDTPGDFLAMLKHRYGAVEGDYVHPRRLK